jgi:hypothetical protein
VEQPVKGQAAVVTLRQGLKPHGFFCLSSVGEKLRNGAWLRLIALVMEEEKHGNTPSIQVSCFLGGAMPVGAPMPFEKG